MREVVCADALEWMFDHLDRAPIVTSPPDAAELGWSIEEWEPWFRGALHVCMYAAGDFPSVFYVTDRRSGGRLHSKAGMVLDAAQAAGLRVLWHKVALRRGVGATDLYRPTFSHLIAVGSDRCKPGATTPDVIDRGLVMYANGMGVNAARLAAQYLLGQGYTEVVNPFCGRGTILAAANGVGLAAVGIDNDPDQCKASAEAWFGGTRG